MIRLEPVTKHNWKECAALKVAEHQTGFVPSNLYSIAEAQFYPQSCPCALYNAADELVGFLLYGRDDSSGKWKIFRLMIDAAYQRRGYAFAAMQQAVAIIRQKPDAGEILIAYQQENEAARRLYRQMGFVEAATKDHVVTAVLHLKNTIST
jgi:diamine N-acetyltransferase